MSVSSDPLAITLPKLGLTMTEATVNEWLGETGKHYSEGDLLALIETDKVTYEIAAPSAGTLGIIKAAAGETLPIGAVLAAWQPDAIETTARPAQLERAPLAKPEPAVPAAPEPAAAPAERDAIRIIATPLARRLAAEYQIDLRTISGSGPRGRIKAVDVHAAARAGETTKETQIGRAHV